MIPAVIESYREAPTSLHEVASLAANLPDRATLLAQVPHPSEEGRRRKFQGGGGPENARDEHRPIRERSGPARRQGSNRVDLVRWAVYNVGA